MKREIFVALLLVMVITSSTLILASRTNNPNDDRFGEKHCIQNASMIKKQNVSICHSDYKSNYSSCKATYKQCKIDAVNFSITNSSNRTEIKELLKQCRVDYLDCKNDSRNDRFECIKNAIDEFESAKEQCRQDQLEGCSSNEQCRFNEFCKLDSCSSSVGKCERKPMHCTDNFAPVCGCNNQTYGNTCFLNNAGVPPSYEGECNDNSIV